MPIAHLDFTPARTPAARDPLPSWFGFASHGPDAGRVLAGLEFHGAEPHPFAPISYGTAPAGQTLRSVYSLALKRAIALAQIELKFAVPGTVLHVRARRREGFEDIPARVVSLPFL
jgi:glycine cleavage system aminomethyltransferase T